MKFRSLLISLTLLFSSVSYVYASPKLGIKFRYGELNSRHSFYRAENDTVYYTNDRQIKCEKEGDHEHCSDSINPIFPITLTGSIENNEGFNKFFFVEYTNFNYDLLYSENFNDKSYFDTVNNRWISNLFDSTNFRLVGRNFLFGFGLKSKFYFLEYGLGLLSSFFDYELSLLDCSDLSKSGFFCSPREIIDSRNLSGFTINPFFKFSLVYYNSDSFRISTDLRLTKLSDYYPYYGLPCFVYYTKGEQFPGIEYRYDNDFTEIIAITYYF